MYVCVYVAVCAGDTSSTCSSRKRNSMRALRHANNAGGKGRQRTARVNSKYGSPNLLYGPRMYSKLISESEQPRRDLDNTDKGHSWENSRHVYEAIRLNSAGELRMYISLLES